MQDRRDTWHCLSLPTTCFSLIVSQTDPSSRPADFSSPLIQAKITTSLHSTLLDLCYSSNRANPGFFTQRRCSTEAPVLGVTQTQAWQVKEAQSPMHPHLPHRAPSGHCESSELNFVSCWTLCSTQYRKDTDLLEEVQRRPPR